MSIRVVIADDHPVVRDGLRFSIERSGRDITVVGWAGDGQAVLDLAGGVSVDVYVLDVTMPTLNGIDTLRALVQLDPEAKVLMLSFQSSESVVGESLRAGARGFLTKETATRCVVEAIEEVHAGRYYLSPDIAHYVVRHFVEASGPAEPQTPAGALTPQERRVLQLVAEGHSSRTIADLLHVSINTIQKHRANLMAKLDIHNLAGLVRYALKEKIAKG